MRKLGIALVLCAAFCSPAMGMCGIGDVSVLHVGRYGDMSFDSGAKVKGPNEVVEKVTVNQPDCLLIQIDGYARWETFGQMLVTLSTFGKLTRASQRVLIQDPKKPADVFQWEPSPF
jgi:hypothetical protein